MDSFGRLPDDVLKYMCMMSLPILFELENEGENYYLHMKSLCFEQWFVLDYHRCDDYNMVQNRNELKDFLNDQTNGLNLLDDCYELIVVVHDNKICIEHGQYTIHLPLTCLSSLLSTFAKYYNVFQIENS